MSIIKLSPRLQAIADHIPAGAALADIGTDHAYLPVYLLQSGKIRKAIASDIRPGPLQSARATADKYQIYPRISLRLGFGLEKIEATECDTIVIAGMGGENIRDILKAALWTKKGKHLIFLQPMSMAQELRYAVLNDGYEIQEEFLSRENHHLYTIMQCRGTGGAARQAVPFEACAASPALLRDPDCGGYLKKEIEKREKILLGLRQSARKEEEQQELVQKTLTCLKKYLQEVARYDTGK